ncbi:hypothetical protein Lal_00013388 [Lupinus albus]|nr:hypothetical protein Lal_00013388 [Lupinus albus]
MKSKKGKVEDEYEDGNPCDEVTDLLHTQPIETPRTSTSQKGKGRIGSYFMPRTTLGTQPTLKCVMQSKEAIEKCDIAISKWMIEVFVPFNATNSTYYQHMIDALCSMGPGYKGTVFLESVDASHDSKTADLLFKLFKEVVMYVGPENIIHIVTDNAANYVAAGSEDKLAMSFLYQAFFKARHEIERSLLDVFEKHAHEDPDLLDKLTGEMRIYRDVELDFGRSAAIREWSKVISNQWLEIYGCRTQNLQRLEHQKLNDFVFVRYNLRLQQRSHLRHQNYDPVNLEIFEDHSHSILEESPPLLTVEEIDALRNDIANISIQQSLDDNDKLNLEDGDDDAQLNPMENVNMDDDNVGQASSSNDEEIEL